MAIESAPARFWAQGCDHDNLEWMGGSTCMRVGNRESVRGWGSGGPRCRGSRRGRMQRRRPSHPPCTAKDPLRSPSGCKSRDCAAHTRAQINPDVTPPEVSFERAIIHEDVHMLTGIQVSTARMSLGTACRQAAVGPRGRGSCGAPWFSYLDYAMRLVANSKWLFPLAFSSTKKKSSSSDVPAKCSAWRVWEG